MYGTEHNAGLGLQKQTSFEQTCNFQSESAAGQGVPMLLEQPECKSLSHTTNSQGGGGTAPWQWEKHWCTRAMVQQWSGLGMKLARRWYTYRGPVLWLVHQQHVASWCPSLLCA